MELVKWEFPFKPLMVAPIGDIQWNGDPHEIALERLREHIIRALDQGAWFLGMGDYIDFMSPSNRARLNSADFYDGPMKTLDDVALHLTTEVFNILAPTKGRWLGLLEGHHFYRLQSGITTDMKLAEMLGTRFLGSSAFVRLMFADNRPRLSADIWCHHGMGQGKAHAPIMKLESLSPYWEADIFMIGHMTKMASAPINRCYPEFRGPSGEGHLRHKKIQLVGTGGWSKGYIEGVKQGQVPRGGYVERKMLNPVCLGAPLVRLVPRESDKTETRYSIDITVEV